MAQVYGSFFRHRCNSSLGSLTSLSRQCLSSLRCLLGCLLVRLRHLLKIVLAWASANKGWIIPVAIFLAEIVLRFVIGGPC